jgi:hypothetical protein
LTMPDSMGTNITARPLHTRTVCLLRQPLA